LISETGRIKDARELRVLLGDNGKRDKSSKYKGRKLKKLCSKYSVDRNKRKENHISMCGTYNTKKKQKKGNFSRTSYSDGVGEDFFVLLFYCKEEERKKKGKSRQIF